jgi:hypothetical protein
MLPNLSAREGRWFQNTERRWQQQQRHQLACRMEELGVLLPEVQEELAQSEVVGHIPVNKIGKDQRRKFN